MLTLRIALGKHPVSTTITMELVREVDAICKNKDCSRYRFISDAITEKAEREKIERKETEPDSSRANKRDQEDNSGIAEATRDPLHDIDNE